MINTTLTHYKITSKLGQGGMGEVYKATDRKLDREVAIKVLPSAFAHDKERLARFEREAKVLAQLSHPNVASVFGFDEHKGTWFLVMECVEGDDLAQRLKRGPLPLDEAIEIGKQLAEGLEAAHAKGIIHRDLKPANIKVTSEGQIKVLDFGLAKATVESSVPSGLGAAQATGVDLDSPTLTDAFTQPGTILGTAAYMSPEQARGKPIDKRSDIWSFGCVLFECLSGRRAFEGDDTTETLAGIIKGEPDWDALPPTTPLKVQRLLRKCLAKDRKRRLHDVADARIELEETIENPMALSDEVRRAETSQTLPLVRVALLVFVIALIAAAATWFLKPTGVDFGSSTPSPKRSEIILKNDARLFQKFANPFALSPGGKLLAYIKVDDKVVTDRQLHIRNLETGVDVPVLGAGGIVAPFFSPASDRIGFISGNSLVTQRLDGGDRRIVVPDGLPLWDFNSADWSADGHIVYAGRSRELMIVDQDGVMPPRALTEAGEHEVHRNPRFLDDGKLVAFSVLNSESGETNHVEVVNTQSGERKSLDIGAFTEVRYLEDGFLLCSKGSELHAVPFDIQTLDSTGQRKPVLSGIRSKGTTLYDIAKDGTLIYQPGHDSKGAQRGLFWADELGNIIQFSNRSGDWDAFALAPDDTRVALVIESDIWILDTHQAANHTLRPLIQHPARDSHPVWSPDGSTLYFYSDRETPNGNDGIWRAKLDNIESVHPELIYASESMMLLPVSASENDLYLQNPQGDLSQANDAGGDNLWKINLHRDDSEAELLVGTPSREVQPSISPNGKWLAYASNETGSREIFVKPLFPPGPSKLVSLSGSGDQPTWAPDGRRLFWVRGPRLEYIDWSEDGTPGTDVGRFMDQQFGTHINTEFSLRKYFISRDGRRSLVLAHDAKAVMAEWVDSAPPIHLKMITHWIQSFKGTSE